MRRSLGIVLLLAVLSAAVVASIAVGSRVIGVGEVWHALWADPSVDHSDAVGIVQQLRVPRTLLGLVVGLAVGAAGALSQGHTRNPLADPGMLGVNAGAACAVVTGVYLLHISSPLAYLGFGLIGAVIAATAVFGVASLTGNSPLTLILAGTGMTAALTAVTSAVVLVDTNSLDAWRFWSVGATSGRSIDVFWAALPFIVAGLVLAVANGHFLNVLSLGDAMSTALGARVALTRAIGILAITLLIGAATAACGPIVFLGLVVPHIARAYTGPDYRWIVPYSALLGAILLLVCDVIGRVIARPGEVQVGVVLALLGAPFLIAMVRRRKLVGV